MFDKIIKGERRNNRNKIYTLCPFHNDKKMGSFSIDREKGYFNCFSCGESGSIYDYVKQVYSGFEGVSNYKIAKFINEIEGYEAIPLSIFSKNKGVENEEIKVSTNVDLLLSKISFNKEKFLNNPYLKKKFMTDKHQALSQKISHEDNIYFLNDELESYNFVYINNDNQEINVFISNKDVLIKTNKDTFQIIRPDGSKQFILGYKNSYTLIEKNQENPYVIAEGFATALSYLLLDFNVIVAYTKNNIKSVIRDLKTKKILHKLFVSVDCDLFVEEENEVLTANEKEIKKKLTLEEYESYKNNLKKLGVQLICFDEVQGASRKKGFDANDYLLNYNIDNFKLLVEKELKKYSYKVYIEGSNIRIYTNKKMEYIVILNNCLYECGTLKKAIQCIASCLNWYKQPESKSLYSLIEDYIIHNTKTFDRFGYSPNRLFLEEYQFGNEIILNKFQEDGLLKLPLHLLEKNEFNRIKEIINNNTENNFDWFCNFLANKIQDPENKPHLGIVMYSNGFGGSGKSTLAKILHYIFGKNCLPEISQASLKNSKYNDFLFNNLIWCAEEISAQEHGNILQEIKTALTSNFMEKRQRYQDSVGMENYGNGIILSDKGLPIILENNRNRRFVVFESKAEIPESYGIAVSEKEQEMMKEIKAFVRYLIEYKIQPVKAIETESKQKLIVASQTPEQAIQEEFLNKVISEKVESSWLTRNNSRYIPYFYISNFLSNNAFKYKLKTTQTIASFYNDLLLKIPVAIKKTSYQEADFRYVTRDFFVIKEEDIEKYKQKINIDKV